ncbi:helix-turn-helix domain-containing protein [Bacillus sp. USDA818B3_A]|uniref:helix-turn-helix domain-containing protein n=1 Tax=Bacillus sp. USDA818B3_A TaxID=2698834 RepID=UPI001370387E|nr:AraC family transcriptional regulator [Bacillus sp. USDA818B3_A]
MGNIYANTYESTNAIRLPFIDWNIRFFGAHMQTVSKEWSVAREFHHAFEILIVLEGEQETIIENETYSLNSGDIMLIPPGVEHINRCISNNNMTYFCAHFDIDEPSFRIEMLKHCDLIYTSTSPFYQRIKSTLENWLDLLSKTNDRPVKDKLKIQIVLFELLEIFSDIVSQNQKNVANLSMTTTKYAKEIADAIKSTFKRHYLNNADADVDPAIHIQPIIASLGLSPNYGLEIFQKVYNMSPRAYLSELKLQEAKILIQQPEISLKEISNRLGYKNLSHFSRQFKRWTGVSPTEFRKNSIHRL